MCLIQDVFCPEIGLHSEDMFSLVCREFLRHGIVGVDLL